MSPTTAGQVHAGGQPRPTFPLRIIHLRAVKEMTSLGTTSIYEGMKAGTFPKSVRLGARRVGWVLSDVQAWIQARVADSTAPTTTEGKS